MPGYFGQTGLQSTVLIECRMGDGETAATVTAISQTPGLDLAVEADEPGLGTDCAVAVSRALALPGMSAYRMKRLPLGDDGARGFVYVFQR